MSELMERRSEAAKITGQIADHIHTPGELQAINWLAILALMNQLLPIILTFLKEGQTEA